MVLETKNRLVASKLYENVKYSEHDETIKEIAYPKLIEAIAESPSHHAEPKALIPNELIRKILESVRKK